MRWLLTLGLTVFWGFWESVFWWPVTIVWWWVLVDQASWGRGLVWAFVVGLVRDVIVGERVGGSSLVLVAATVGFWFLKRRFSFERLWVFWGMGAVVVAGWMWGKGGFGWWWILVGPTLGLLLRRRRWVF